MRTTFQGLAGKRVKFTATFWKYGVFRKNGCVGRTILLMDIRDLNRRKLADHIWINYTAAFDAYGEFHQGDQVSFDAAVSEYTKGYFGNNIEDRIRRPFQIDYRLKYPHNVALTGTGQIGENLRYSCNNAELVAH